MRYLPSLAYIISIAEGVPFITIMIFSGGSQAIASPQKQISAIKIIKVFFGHEEECSTL